MIYRVRKFHQKHRDKIHAVMRPGIYLLGFFVLCLVYWINQNFGQPSIEQIFYHLQFGADGLVDTDMAIVASFTGYCLLLPIPLTVLAVLMEKLLRRARIYVLDKAISAHSAAANHTMIKIFKVLDWVIGHKAPLYLLLFSIIYFGVQFSALAYIHNQFGKDYFAQHYIYPSRINITAANPKNLVLIYVESMEDSYSDPKLFGKNLLSSMDKLHGMSFNKFRQVPGTNWTIAGMTATQCGVPLKSVTMFDGNDQGENVNAFLPNAVCLGDVLNKFGYRNVYMGGDALSFSGKGKFYQDHHFDEVYGREELKGSLTQADMNFWGLYDDDLFQKAKVKLRELHDSRQRFNLTISTIDTHGPDGHYSKWCRQQGVKDFEGIVECTSNQVADFVKFIKQSGYLKDTNVVILGDHLAMENPVYATLEKSPERHVFNSWISRKPFTKNRDAIVHFDMFPTILEFINIHVAGDRLGLGYSAISKSGILPSPNEYEEMKEDLLNKSDKYLDLWAKHPAAAE
ncbi:MAG: sulfatase-like hydrolase/transferase [Methylophilaceae bacterium]